VGLVIRRGPSRAVATILWNRKTDEFTLGQWLRGRIYERRSDLSADGKHFIYFAMNGRWKSKAKGAWTAISRAPFLKATHLFAKGDCWHGGGLFTGDRKYWLNDGYGHSELQDSRTLYRDAMFRPPENYGGECPGVYYPRLQRDGWQLVSSERRGELSDVSIFEKALSGGWILRKFAHAQVGAPPGKGCYWDEHELVNDRFGVKTVQQDWEWADVDGQRLVWAANGQLWAGYLRSKGVQDAKRLHDFNSMEFESIVAPY